jgi:hypothetical protein
MEGHKRQTAKAMAIRAGSIMIRKLGAENKREMSENIPL